MVTGMLDSSELSLPASKEGLEGTDSLERFRAREDSWDTFREEGRESCESCETVRSYLSF